MNSEQIIKSDVLDILFENRNKMYGAYNLRKFYSNRLYKALGAMLAAVTVFAAFAFRSPHKTKFEIEVPDNGFATVKAALKEPPPAEQPKPQPKQRMAQVQHTTNITIVKNKLDVDTIRTITATTAIGTTYVDPGPGDEPPLVGSTPGTGGPGPVAPAPTPAPEPVINPEEPVDNPDVQPQFPGGIDKLRAYLQNHLTNPRDIEEGEKVKVVMRFVVGYDGKLKAFEIVQDGGDDFNREVIRVLKRMPAWIPGRANGRNVSVVYTQPVVFVSAD